ncbi:MAG: ATP-dependent DNA ligase [Thermoprotei archaeon]|nr:MAG: ATP-dependent DNA ligase [Thermoprotei archaeon]
MKFSEVVKILEAIESTSKRTEMTKLLVLLFKKTPSEVIDKVIYFIQGQLLPDWVGLELGIGEKLAMRALSIASGVSLRTIEETYKKIGDLGEAAERVLTSKRRGTSILDFLGATGATTRELTMGRVYDTLMKIAKATGEGAQDTKISLLASLLSEASPREAKYILRFVTGRLRLGVADMTILDALAEAFAGGKARRDILERAYNVHPDLGYIAKVLVREGIEGIKKFRITPGVPVLPMLAERLSSSSEILAKLGGRCIAEYKYDGERAQIHKIGDKVVIYSRRLENLTHAFPDVCELVRKHIKSKEAIIEGEIVAYNPETDELLPFQELMHRRRKHNVEEAMRMYPVKLFLFDCLYVDGEELTDAPLLMRKKKLIEIVEETDRVSLARWRIVDNTKDLELFFNEAISEGCEGLVCKSLKGDSIYQMGARGWLWIKFKRDYRSEMTDTVDLVAVGAFWGKGKRGGTYGALLLAAYDPETDTFKTVCKCGSGFTDEDLARLPEIFKPYVIPHKHPRVDSKIEADVWFVPAIVLEVIGAEITLSPLHTCGYGAIKEGVGLAIRFPRFTGRWRFDKKPEQATTVKEIIEMYKRQKKVVREA